MAITDNTYFISDIYLPQVGNKYQTEAVNSALEKYEPEILKKLLGYELWKILDDAWRAFNQTTPVPLPDRIDKIINGDDFTVPFCGSEIKLRWNGLINTEKVSLLSYYTYFKYRGNTESRTTTTGESKSEKENAVNAPVLPKLVYSYNQMVNLYGETPNHYQSNMTGNGYAIYYLSQDNYAYHNIEPSCYNYLLTNIETYPEWRFKPVHKINQMGI